MKANEAPEKIYLQENTTTDCYGDFWPEWFEARAKDSDIEYTRTDAFVEKALKWYCLDCECNDNCKDSKCFFHNAYKLYLEGEPNCLPPKFTSVILNEDGSTSDDWRYRHFTSKMQDAFIKKACEWIKENITNNHNANSVLVRNGCVTLGMLIEDFKNYMKGE